jgi:L-asparagine transporter-like permease
MQSIKSKYLAYLKSLAIFSVLLGLVAYASVFIIFRLDLSASAFFFTFSFFVILSAGLHFILLRASGKRPQQFVNTFTGITGGKLFLLLIILMIYMVLNKEGNRTHFVVVFLCLYLFYTAFEVIQLFRNLKGK